MRPIESVTITLDMPDGTHREFTLEAPNDPEAPFEYGLRTHRMQGVYQDRIGSWRKGDEVYKFFARFSYNSHSMDIRWLLVATNIRLRFPPSFESPDGYQNRDVLLINEEAVRNYLSGLAIGGSRDPAMYHDGVVLEFEGVTPLTWDGSFEIDYGEGGGGHIRIIQIYIQIYIQIPIQTLIATPIQITGTMETPIPIALIMIIIRIPRAVVFPVLIVTLIFLLGTVAIPILIMIFIMIMTDIMMYQNETPITTGGKASTGIFQEDEYPVLIVMLILLPELVAILIFIMTLIRMNPLTGTLNGTGIMETLIQIIRTKTHT